MCPGICWHGVVLTLPARNRQPAHTVFLHDILHAETQQDAPTVLAILEAVASFIRREYPWIEKVIIQTDNARCYLAKVFMREYHSSTIAVCSENRRAF